MGIFSKKRKPDEPRQPSPIAVVYFAVDASKLAKMDVAFGPCVPLRGSRHAIESPLNQDGGETPEQSAALFTVLTGRPAAEAFETAAVKGAGTLFICTPAFADALADKSQAMLDMIHAGREDDFLAERHNISRAWMQSIEWPDHYVSLVNRLHRLALAREARATGLPLYCWAGPSVPMRSVVSGSDPYPGPA